jgi:hypothetical protein
VKTEGMFYVCFDSVFRSENTPCVNHVTRPDGAATMCGRRGWRTFEEPYDPGLGALPGSGGLLSASAAFFSARSMAFAHAMQSTP